uniref:Uncharacterized protein n=1 Tax=Rhizophora mucronata TaxID=61149 RepID=A0A2P2NE12_RHIMU
MKESLQLLTKECIHIQLRSLQTTLSIS